MKSPSRAILLTPAGAAAIAVVRITGPLTISFLDQYFSGKPAPSRCVHGELRDGERVIDDPVVVLFPDSNGADINLHGGPWVVQSFLDLARREGFEIVDDPGSIHDDAIDASSTLEREMLIALPRATTELAIRALLAQPAAWERWLATSPDAIARRRVSEDRSLEWLLHSPTVAIVGIPNTGKSTLANQLFATQRSITSDEPGTTRDWVSEIANIDGLAVTLTDTPGVRETDDDIERQAIARAAHQVGGADLILILLDVSRAIDEQREILNRYPAALRIANKSDLEAKWSPEALRAIRITARTGEGVQNVRHAIREFFGVLNYEMDEPRCWTDRQRNELNL